MYELEAGLQLLPLVNVCILFSLLYLFLPVKTNGP